LQGAACQAIGIPTREIPAKNGVSRAAGDLTAAHEDRVVASVSAVQQTPGVWPRLVAFLGAGIYEEVLFRLMLLPCCVAALTRVGVPRAKSLVAAVIVTSLVFALAHYIGPHGDRWQSFSFLFRAVAGSFFATLFVYRGFGIAAGAHAGYDILVGLC
jgi:membrane protease YdiL (CAAX protease family)